MRAIEVLGGALQAGSDPGAARPDGPAGRAAAVGAIAAHDPAFDEAAVVAHAQAAHAALQEAWAKLEPGRLRPWTSDGLWRAHALHMRQLRERGGRHEADLRLVEAALLGVHRDDRWETFTVRLGVEGWEQDVDGTGTTLRGSRARARWHEDWTFQRASSSTTRTGGGVRSQRCPSCGAPLQLDDAGTCSYCREQVVGGTHDWVLVKVSPAVTPNAPHVAVTSLVEALQSAAVASAMASAAGPAVVPSRRSRGAGCFLTIALLAAIAGGVAYAVSRTGEGIQGAVRSVQSAASSISEQPGPAGAGGATDPTRVPGPGDRLDQFNRVVGHLTLTGAITYDADVRVFLGAFNDKPCTTLALAARGATANVTFPGAGILTIGGSTSSAAQQGPGRYDGTTAVLSNEDGIRARDQQWVAGATRTIFELNPDGSGRVSMSGLQPRNPAGPFAAPLSATLTFSCREVTR